eukprot:ANDGO_06473.mRNA.1 hypothetical protein
MPCFPSRKKAVTLRSTPAKSWDVPLHLMELLHEVVILCHSKGWRPYLDFGSLLGCIRTGVMVPWDYDVDISFFEEDYNQMLEFFNSLPAKTLGNMRWDALTSYTMGDPATCRIFHAVAPVRYPWKENMSFETGIDIMCVKMYPETKECGTSMRAETYQRWRGVYTHPEDCVYPLKQEWFMGIKCWVPNKPEEVLKRNYGKNWKKPDVSQEKVDEYGILTLPPCTVISKSTVFCKIVPLKDPAEELTEKGSSLAEVARNAAVTEDWKLPVIVWFIAETDAEQGGLDQPAFESAKSMGAIIRSSDFGVWGKLFAVEATPLTAILLDTAKYWWRLAPTRVEDVVDFTPVLPPPTSTK